MNDVYGMLPINRTAGLVTGQSGCSVELTTEQIRDNVVKKKKAMEAELLSLPKKSDRRKELGRMLTEINNEINALRPKLRARGVDNYFIGVARSQLSAFEFNRWMTLAADKLRADQNKLNNSEE